MVAVIFLLYAYDLFEVIYQEAWEDENSPLSEVTGRKLREDYPNLEELHRQLPTLILKYNLHGIDIDARACQIAALALWLRAQRSYQSLKIKLAERPPIQKINIVCAEPMPGEEELLAEFITELNQKRPPIIGELVRKVFEKMNLAGETGALLKIEEEIRDEITLAKTQWLSEYNPMTLDILLFVQKVFSMVPNTPFCYWVSDHIRQLFTKLPQFGSNGRTVKQGLATADDFRFVRTSWEIPINSLCSPIVHQVKPNGAYCIVGSYCWFPFAKGGEYSPYYADIHLVVNWAWDGKEIRNFINPINGKTNSRPQNTDFYFQSGLTYPRRSTSGFGIRALPSGCVFADKGTSIFVQAEYKIATLGILFSKAYQTLIEVNLAAGDEVNSGTAGRSYEVGIIQKLPWSDLSKHDIQQFTEWVNSLIQGVRERDINDETKKYFICPYIIPENGIKESAESWQRLNEKQDCKLIEKAAQVDIRVAEILEVSPLEREKIFGEDAATLCSLPVRKLDLDFDLTYKQSIYETIRDEIEESGGNRQVAVKSYYASRHLEVLAKSLNVNPKHIAQVAAERHLLPDGLCREFAQTLLSYTVGCAFGRWDIRFATGKKSAPELPDPFAPLPVCSPGMLIGTDGLPLSETPPKYPIPIAWDGILVDDPNHPNDITRHVREVLEIIWKNNASNIEQEACEIIGVRELCDYFQRPANFFQDHLKRYSKSRRKAPIYWPLSTTSGSYTVWIYYHRLTDQTLYTIVNRYLEPKITEVERTTGGLEKELEAKSGREASQVRDNLHATRKFLSELQDMKQELLHVAQLPYKPNLNDGAIITAAPLHRLFGLRQWAQETKKCWESLEKGEYDWAHLAYTIWTDRVREVCKRDKSIAIAHGLEEVYEVANPENSQPKATKGRSRKKTIQESV